MTARLSDRVAALLDSRVFATVATLQPGGAPHLSVVWIGRERCEVVFVVQRGSRKERNLRRDDRAAVLVYPAENPYSYVAVRGRCRLGSERAREIMDGLSLKYTGLRHEEFWPDAPDAHELVVVRLLPRHVHEIGLPPAG
ncbi:PPOX class F420-dependent oxidoreductase [Saccharopolyspora rosea]|uniref:PPOX class F420-dependent oxidoreductase n=1 Tax=Saccharopolyspora rosea TaxID=524884 RepID=UPI0021DAABAC|nr:PPOX class F420-dependent oxidoreductase [Saccharopolyspora rosea]